MDRPAAVLARATVHLSGVSLGQLVWVNPDAPYIADCLQAGFLVLEPSPEPAAGE